MARLPIFSKDDKLHLTDKFGDEYLIPEHASFPAEITSTDNSNEIMITVRYICKKVNPDPSSEQEQKSTTKVDPF